VRRPSSSCPSPLTAAPSASSTTTQLSSNSAGAGRGGGGADGRGATASTRNGGDELGGELLLCASFRLEENRLLKKDQRETLPSKSSTCVPYSHAHARLPKHRK
jgi:hypothetical protein